MGPASSFSLVMWVQSPTIIRQGWGQEIKIVLCKLSLCRELRPLVGHGGSLEKIIQKKQEISPFLTNHVGGREVFKRCLKMVLMILINF